MRIITGIARGTKLETLAGEDIVRPTTEMAKEGIFSSIQFDLEGRRVLDLFAGSGQLGLEALSRGAQSAVFVDANSDAVDVVKKNAQKTKLFGSCRIVRMDYTEYLKRCSDTFHFIFIDPPYGLNILPEVVKKILKADILAEDGIMICECSSEELDMGALPVELVKRYKYGKTYIHTFRKA